MIFVSHQICGALEKKYIHSHEIKDLLIKWNYYTMFYYIIFWTIKFFMLNIEHIFRVLEFSWSLLGLEIQKNSLENASY